MGVVQSTVLITFIPFTFNFIAFYLLGCEADTAWILSNGIDFLLPVDVAIFLILSVFTGSHSDVRLVNAGQLAVLRSIGPNRQQYATVYFHLRVCGMTLASV